MPVVVGQVPDASLSAPDVPSGDVDASLSAPDMPSGDVDASVSVPDMPSVDVKAPKKGLFGKFLKKKPSKASVAVSPTPSSTVTSSGLALPASDFVLLYMSGDRRGKYWRQNKYTDYGYKKNTDYGNKKIPIMATKKIPVTATARHYVTGGRYKLGVLSQNARTRTAGRGTT